MSVFVRHFITYLKPHKRVWLYRSVSYWSHQKQNLLLSDYAPDLSCRQHHVLSQWWKARVVHRASRLLFHTPVLNLDDHQIST